MVCLFLRNRTAATPEKAVNWDIVYMDEFNEGAGGSSAALSSLVVMHIDRCLHISATNKSHSPTLSTIVFSSWCWN
jgi:hypothetical protein